MIYEKSFLVLTSPIFYTLKCTLSQSKILENETDFLEILCSGAGRCINSINISICPGWPWIMIMNLQCLHEFFYTDNLTESKKLVHCNYLMRFWKFSLDSFDRGEGIFNLCNPDYPGKCLGCPGLVYSYGWESLNNVG